MSRSTLRERVFILLFREIYYTREEFKEQIELFGVDDDFKEEDRNYIIDRLNGIITHLDDIDNVIREKSIKWDFDRIGKVELAILRLAIYEGLYDEEVPIPVAISEAVALCKKYGDDNAYSFVNGILGKLGKDE